MPPEDSVDDSHTVTRLLDRVRAGDRTARDELFDRVYDELRRRAQARLRRAGTVDLDGTALAHEACARLLSRDRIDARDRDHFFAIFSRAMDDALVDAFRRSATLRRGGDRQREPLGEIAADESLVRLDALVVEEAMEALAAADPEAARMVELRIFGGLTLGEAAEFAGTTPAIARGHFDYGRAWLVRHLSRG